MKWSVLINSQLDKSLKHLKDWPLGMTVRELSNLTQCRWHHSIAGDPLCKWTGEPSMSMNSSCSISDYEASTAHFPAMMDLAL